MNAATRQETPALPAEMLQARRWLLWKSIPNQDPAKKPRKVPYYVDGQARTGATDTPEDYARLASYEEACDAMAAGGYAGLGFALGPDGTGNHWQGVDFDGIASRPHLEALRDQAPGVVEVSPSGDGLHFIGYGRDFDTLASNPSGIEAYSKGRYFTVTEQVLGGDLVDLSEFVEAALRPEHQRHAPPTKQREPSQQQPHRQDFAPLPDERKTLEDLRSALAYIDADDYGEWVDTGLALKDLGECARGLWLDWSQSSPRFDWDESSRKWESFKPNKTSYKAIFSKAQARGWRNPGSRQQRMNQTFSPLADFGYLDSDTGEMLNEAPQAVPLHPLAHFAEISDDTPAVKWIIPGVIEHGVITISGARGVGKTTAILPLAMTAAGLHREGDPLAPKHWRHVVYIVEDLGQAKRIVSGIVRYGGLGLTMEQVRERLHLVEARRLDPAYVAQVGQVYRGQFTREVEGVEVLPLVVFDTKAAILALENENDNSEGSRAIAALKQDFSGLPAWIVGHVAKASFGSDDVAKLSDRGAGSFEADTIQNCYLVQDANEQRFLMLGKRRFEAKYGDRLPVESNTAEVLAVDEWGDLETTVLRWGIVTPPTVSRKEAQQQAQEAQQAAERLRVEGMRVAIMDAVQIAHQSGNPISRSGIKGTVRGYKWEAVQREMEALIAEGWLWEVEVPSRQRINNAKARFLVKLDTHDHDEFRKSNKVPPSIFEVPPSWKKPEIPLDPEQGAGEAEKAAKS